MRREKMKVVGSMVGRRYPWWRSMVGLVWCGEEQKQNKTTQNKTKQNKTKQNKTKQNKDKKGTRREKPH